MSIVDVSVALIALAFIVLVYFVATAAHAARQSLKQARETLTQMNETLSRLETQVSELSRESIVLVQSAADLTDQINAKLKTTDPLFASVERVGEAMHEVTSSVKQVSSALSRTLSGSVQKAVRTNEGKISEATQLVSLAMQLYGKWKQLRNHQRKE